MAVSHRPTKYISKIIEGIPVMPLKTQYYKHANFNDTNKICQYACTQIKSRGLLQSII